MVWRAAGGCAAAPAPADFALCDGDTVAFLGDSITAARGYAKIVEHYTLMRYPERRVRFINAGQGGDTASGAVARLERDVFTKKATVVTVAFGVNDIGWGMKANAESKQRYLDGVSNIVTQCQARKIRVFICSPAITAEAPDKAENGFLQKMMDEGLALAKSLGAEAIDLQRGMRAVQRRVVEANAKETDPKKLTRLHVEDGAQAMVRGLEAEATMEPVNIGVARGISVIDMAKLIKRYVGYEGEIRFDLSKPDGVAFKTVDGSRGAKLLGWSPEIPFEEGVRQTIDWYIKHGVK